MMSNTEGMRAATWVLVLMACGGASPETRSAADVQAHGEVDWQGWNAEAFARAERERKLILVSVQAGWCHWCHVMNEETYTDAEVRRLLAEHFVAIKVDSDARPDLAERYQRWAWPATAVLSPDAEPVTEMRGHQPAPRFAGLLSEIVDDLVAGRPIARREAPTDQPDPALADLATLRDHVREQLDGLYDDQAHGWGRPQKYPWSAPVEHALFRAAQLGDDARGQQAVATLDRHAELIDPVWGGMYQYSTRGVWERPHYEKIAAIQAGAIHNFAQAHRATGEERWIAHARDVERYVREFLTDPEGGFYTSQDADLGTHGGMHLPGNEFYALDDAARRSAGIPHIDDNVYANLNGQMIRAFAELYQATLDEETLQLARRAADRVLRTHAVGEGLAHGPVDGAAPVLLYLPDQMEMARGLLALYDATAEIEYRDAAERLARFAIRELSDADGGGFYAHTEDPAAAGVFARRRKPLIDNGVAARVLIQLYRLRGDDAFREAAAGALRGTANRTEIRQHGRKVGEYLLALEELATGYAILSVVGHEDEATGALHRAAVSFYYPGRLVELGRPGASRYPYPGESAVYLCSAEACSLPVTDPAELEAAALRFLQP